MFSSALHNINNSTNSSSSRRVKVTLILFVVVCSLIIVSTFDIDFSFSPFSSSPRTITPLENLITTLRSNKKQSALNEPQQQQGEENVLDVDVTSTASSSSLPNYVKFLLSQSVVDRWKNIFDIDILQEQEQNENNNKNKRSSSSSLDSSEIFPCHKEMMMAWTMKLGDKTPKELPSCFSDIKTFLKSIQFFVSVGLSRIAYDKGLNDFYSRLHLAAAAEKNDNTNDVILLENFEMKIAQMIVSYLQSAQLACQTWVDAYEYYEHTKKSFFSFFSSAKNDDDNNDDVDESTKPYRKAQDDVIEALGLLKRRRRTNTQASSSSRAFINNNNNKAARWLLKRSNLIRVQPPEKWKDQIPIEGKFWNTFRPTLPCSSLQRNCENPESCRYLCNLEYNLEKSLLGVVIARPPAHAGGGEVYNYTDEAKKVSAKNKQLLEKYLNFQLADESGYTMVGFGSNNEFGWEDSMIYEFDSFNNNSVFLKDKKNETKNKKNKKRNQKYTSAPSSSSLVMKNKKFFTNSSSSVKLYGNRTIAPGIKSITTFDCTLLTRKNPGVRPSTPVELMTDRFRFVPFCLTGGNVPSLLNFGNSQQLPPSTSKKSFDEIFESKEASAKSISMAELRMVLEWKDKNKKKNDDDTDENDNNSNGDKDKQAPSSSTSSRKINLLKVDVESFEFVSLSRWLQLDLYQIRKQLQQQLQQQQKDSRMIINFQTFPFLEVEQLQIEVHRLGIDKHAAEPIGALWMMWMHMTMYALGFMPVSAEKNHFTHNCFEFVLVHSRFFVESEVLMPLMV